MPVELEGEIRISLANAFYICENIGCVERIVMRAQQQRLTPDALEEAD
jgi:hypothetical protein